MIINEFMRWAQTARTTDRTRAASALGQAYLQSDLTHDERNAAVMAMTYLLDDPSPRVRLAMAEAIADSSDAPRSIILSLADDQAEVAGTVLVRSPILTNRDLVDFASKGDSATRTFIASRLYVSKVVSAAICEIGSETEVETLLDNPGAEFSGVTLFRICSRLGDRSAIRNLLTERNDLPAAGRHMLIEHVSTVLATFQLVQDVIGEWNVARIKREALDGATVAMVGEASSDEIPELVDHLRAQGSLTPSFLIHALCTGKVDFFAEVIVNLTGFSLDHVRSIMARGSIHPLRALYEKAGLSPEIIRIFVETTCIWRQMSGAENINVLESVSSRLLKVFENSPERYTSTRELLDMVERLVVNEHRLTTRNYAYDTLQQAA